MDTGDEKTSLIENNNNNRRNDAIDLAIEAVSLPGRHTPLPRPPRATDDNEPSSSSTPERPPSPQSTSSSTSSWQQRIMSRLVDLPFIQFYRYLWRHDKRQLFGSVFVNYMLPLAM